MASALAVSKRTALSWAHSKLALAHRSSFCTTLLISTPSTSQVTSSGRSQLVAEYIELKY